MVEIGGGFEDADADLLGGLLLAFEGFGDFVVVYLQDVGDEAACDLPFVFASDECLDVFIR